MFDDLTSVVIPWCGASRLAVEVSVAAASPPGHRPAELKPNLLGLHAEPDSPQSVELQRSLWQRSAGIIR